ncbi:xanthine dehydrogenase accessory protein XdhC [Deinococcus sp. YIM 134068]|uniref:xanthine dehydrogenase accessory protein XdhC n=1 Tax=Deinococcus lichenicola TaxID=3118910 RepID=UPI002F925E81
MAPNWLTAVQTLAERGEPGVLVTVAAVRGHAPREAGAKMVVGTAETWDSVGGGNLEATAVERARALLACGASAPELLTLRLTDRAPNEYGRQCCGGEVTLLLEPLATVRPHLAIFGVGHVGLALAHILNTLPVHLHLIDSRAAQLAPERLAGLEGGAARRHVHHTPIPELALADLPAGSHLVVMTHDHAEDAALCDAALRRPDLGFVGLIGSKVKWARFREQLAAVGHSPDALTRITTPIGLPGIRGKSPAVIALSVAAQLQQVMEAEPAPSPIPQRTP